MLNGRTFDEQHFSPLKEITDKNVSGLGLAWFLDIDSGMGIVAEPIVVDGVAYVSAPLSVVYAVDAAAGKLLWRFDPKIRLNLAINGSYSARTNGGVAVWNGMVYVGTGDCRRIAIDAASGKQLWEAAVCDATQTGITGAPHVAKGKILMGYNGSDDGVRDRWPFTMQTPVEKRGGSGQFPEIRPKDLKPRRSKWPQRPGRGRIHGRLGVAMSGLPSRTTP